MKIRKLSTVFLCTAVCAALLTGCGERRETSLSDIPDESTVSTVLSEPNKTDEVSETSETSGASSAASSDNSTASSVPDVSSANSNDTTSTSDVVSSPTTTIAPTPEQSSSTPQSEPPQPVHQHQYSISASADADCLEVGYKVYICSCGDKYTEVTSEALGHSYSKSTLSPTCTNGGYTTYTCTRCGQSYVDDHTSELGHKYTSSTVKATCTQKGYTLHTCSRCGNEYTSDSTSALGHSWSEWTVTKNATTSSEGEKRSECTRCGETKTEVIEKLKSNSSTYVSEVVRLVNVERAKLGLSPLTVRDDLAEYAQLRSKEIVSNFEHKRPDGASPLDYVMSLNGVRRSGENIAWGQKTPEAVMTAWMNSEGHRNNILTAEYTSIGVGCYESNGRLYWTQIFAG